MPGVVNNSDGSTVKIVALQTAGAAVENTNPLPVTIVDAVASGTFQVGQKVIAVTGTAVQLTAVSYVLQNGIVITSKSTNNAAKATVGTASATNTVDGTGNGYIIEPGASTGIPAGVNINTLYVNGTAGDVFSWEGN